MEYSALGKTGRQVSRLGFGGAPAGLKNYLHPFDPDQPHDQESITAAIRRAYELGVSYFDTAHGYGDGRSERLFGQALQGLDPESLFLATKASVTGGAGVRGSLESSLKNLRRDWIDLLQVHGSAYSGQEVDVILRDNGMLDEMERMRDEGLVRYLGFTCESQNRHLDQLLDTGRFDILQICYNFIFQHPCDPSRKTGSLYEAESHGLGIVTMRSATSGTLQKWIQMVNPGNTFDYTPALLQFQFSNPMVDVALVGMRSAREVEQNVEICNNTAGRIDLCELHQRYV